MGKWGTMTGLAARNVSTLKERGVILCVPKGVLCINTQASV